MFLQRCPLGSLNSVQDMLLQAVWIRREQFRIFETMINIFANGLSLSTKVSNKIEKLADEYIDLVLPGTKEYQKKAEEAFVAKTANTLNEITELLKSHSTAKVT